MHSHPTLPTPGRARPRSPSMAKRVFSKPSPGRSIMNIVPAGPNSVPGHDRLEYCIW
ncbi:hypothetical protein FKP32DRAFT_1595198 [Trametes sanguinea]|nr:hypothetical protein FKP32DRAFT_1595198 [Trametes sanguinea]